MTPRQAHFFRLFGKPRLHEATTTLSRRGEGGVDTTGDWQLTVSYGFDFSRRPIFRPLQGHFFPLWPRDASLSRFGWLYLGSLIIYGLVLSINTRVTWPRREEREKRKRVQFERKKKGGGVSVLKRARDAVFEGGGARVEGG